MMFHRRRINNPEHFLAHRSCSAFLGLPRSICPTPLRAALRSLQHRFGTVKFDIQMSTPKSYVSNELWSLVAPRKSTQEKEAKKNSKHTLQQAAASSQQEEPLQQAAASSHQVAHEFHEKRTNEEAKKQGSAKKPKVMTTKQLQALQDSLSSDNKLFE